MALWGCHSSPDRVSSVTRLEIVGSSANCFKPSPAYEIAFPKTIRQYKPLVKTRVLPLSAPYRTNRPAVGRMELPTGLEPVLLPTHSDTRPHPLGNIRAAVQVGQTVTSATSPQRRHYPKVDGCSRPGKKAEAAAVDAARAAADRVTDRGGLRWMPQQHT